MSRQLTCVGGMGKIREIQLRGGMGKIREIQLRGGTGAYSGCLLDQVYCCLERAQRQLDASVPILSSDYGGASPEDERRMRARPVNGVADLTIKDDRALQICTKSTRGEFVWILRRAERWIRYSQYDTELWRLDYEKPDPGSRRRLAPARALFLHLVWPGGGRTQADLTVEPGIDQGSVSRYLRRIEGILGGRLPIARYMMEKLGRMKDVEEIKGLIPDFDNNVLVDGIHAGICRPQDDREQGAACSSRKRMHTYNTTVLTTPAAAS